MNTACTLDKNSINITNYVFQQLHLVLLDPSCLSCVVSYSWTMTNTLINANGNACLTWMETTISVFATHNHSGPFPDSPPSTEVFSNKSPAHTHKKRISISLILNNALYTVNVPSTSWHDLEKKSATKRCLKIHPSWVLMTTEVRGVVVHMLVWCRNHWPHSLTLILRTHTHTHTHIHMHTM